MYQQRLQCIFCNKIINDTYFIDDKFIHISSNVSENININKIPYNILICNNCGCYQNKYLGDLDLVYCDNHNNIVISDIWIKHYENFFNFIIKKSEINYKVDILEIGGGNNYVANLFIDKNYNNYTILEPVITNKIQGINYIEGYLEDYKENREYYITILSHVYEHLYNPQELFKIKSKYIALSIPNIPNYIDNLILNFLNIEHTYYFEEEHIIILFNNFKFKLVNKEYFQDHSIFMLFEYNNELLESPWTNIKTITINNKFNVYFNKIFKLIEKINNYTKMNNKKFAIFPANMYIQYLIMLGLNIDKINYFYDNNNEKYNKYLYGTTILCKNLNFFIENNDHEIILLGFLYNNEIINYSHLL
jgi:hypothetical protein